MLRRYVVVNDLTGYLCFKGRRFFTSKGAIRRARRGLMPQLMTVRKYVRN